MTWPGEQLLIRLWETLTEKGIGSLLRPWQIRREGRAHVEIRQDEILALAQAERDADAIRAGRVQRAPDGTLTPTLQTALAVWGADPFPNAQAVEVSVRNVVAEGLRREVNVARAVLAAEAELVESNQEVPAQRLSEDWLLRWRDYASAVSSDDLQTLWGRLLAGELKSPGTFSLRTLEFLRTLSREEAVDIGKLAGFSIEGEIVRLGPFLAEQGITFDLILRMGELGVLGERDDLIGAWKSERTDRYFATLESHNRALLVEHEDPAKEASLPIYGLTSIGKALVRLGTFEAHEGYMRRVGEELRRQGFKVTLARVSRSPMDLYCELIQL